MSKIPENGKMSKQVDVTSQKNLEKRIVKSFLDILILVEMTKQTTLSGYDVTSFVNNKFGGILSPGTVYATLYSMERKGLIKGTSDGKKTVYKLTEKGNEITVPLKNEYNLQMTDFIKKFLIM